MNLSHPRIPRSTYRLQFNRNFTFAQAREIVPYLHALGISDCYASPYFQARAESLHGYDITDHNKRNAAIPARARNMTPGSPGLHAREMGQVLDFVPNHMGIGEPLRPGWMDVHARPRFTGDLDILLRPSADNDQRVIAALKEFGFGELALQPADFTAPERVIQLGRAPHRIDLLTSLSGVGIEDAFRT